MSNAKFEAADAPGLGKALQLLDSAVASLQRIVPKRYGSPFLSGK
jgi:hypothetical protein